MDESLSRAKRGDHAAFADLVRAHQAMVFSIANSFLRDRAVAEELAQDVFLDLFRNLASIQSADHLKFWLRRVMSNRCIDYTRRSKTRPFVGLDNLPEPSAEPNETDPLLANALDRYVSTLPEAWRMVVVLRYQEDLDPAEIAELLEVPVNTVKSQLQRSLVMLRAKLGRCLGVSA